MTRRHRTALVLVTLFSSSALAPVSAAWQPVPPSAGRVADLERDLRSPTGLFASTADGLFHSADAGDSWRLLDGRGFDRLATAEGDPTRLYAVDREDGFRFGVFRSDDGGESFNRVSELAGGGFLFDAFHVLTVDPGDPDRLYASLDTSNGELTSEIFSAVVRSTDGGATWTSIRWFPESSEQGGKSVLDLAVAATDARRLYAATVDGLDRSDDGGDSWESVRAGAWSQVVVDPLDEDHVFALGTFAGELWESRDGGATWTRGGAGLPDQRVADLRFDPIDRAVLYALLGEFETQLLGRVFVSHDGGATWSLLDEPLAGPAVDLAVLPTSPRRIFAAADELERTSLPLPLCPVRPGALCLDGGRFLVEVAWEDFQGGRGPGFAAPLTADAGTFWFFEPDNVELAVKVLDARAVNGHWWVFFGALTNVDFDLRAPAPTTGPRSASSTASASPSTGRTPPATAAPATRGR